MSSRTFAASPTLLTNLQSNLHLCPVGASSVLRLKGRFFFPFHRLFVPKLLQRYSFRIPNYATGLRRLSQVSEKTLSFLTKQEKFDGICLAHF